jgi:germination protein M
VNETKLGSENMRTKLYFINTNSHTVEYELRSIAKKEDNTAQLEVVANELVLGSKSTKQTLEFPQEFKIQSLTLNGDTVSVDISSDYENLPQDEKVMGIAAIVYTFTELEFINNVTITSNGTPVMPQYETLTSFNRENMKLNPSIDPEKKNWQMAVLYFADAQGQKLVAEERTIEVKQSLTLEYQIVDQLLTGPENKTLKSVIPAETKIKDIKTEDGICYVNLSGDFISKITDTNQAKLMVFSIVNSLTELDYVNKVQFLIEGEKVEGLHSDFDFSKPFDRNSELLKQ